MSNAVIEHLKTMIPHIEKDQILEDLRFTESALKDAVVPSYRNAASFFSSEKFKSRENEKIDHQIRAIIKTTGFGRPATFLSDFAERLGTIQDNIEILVKMINHEIGRDVVTEGVSSRKVVLMRIAEKLSFVSRFAMDLLNLVYINEASELGTDARSISMSPAEMARAKACIEPLAYLIQSYSIEPKKFEKLLHESPDLMLTRNDNQDVEAMYTEEQLDPITSPLAQGFTWNPIYHIRMHIAEWQVKRYKSTQEKKKVLELRLAHLQMLRESQGSNPALERQIEHYQSVVSGLDHKLRAVEDELEIAA